MVMNDTVDPVDAGGVPGGTRPSRSAGLRLLGPYEGSGYRDERYLVERADRQMVLLQHELAMRDQQFRHVQAAVGGAMGGEGAPEGNAGAAPLVASPLVASLLDTLRQMNAPKRVVRDAQGRVSHVEPIPFTQ